MVLGIHMNNHGGTVYRDDFCINVCNEIGVTIPDVQKYCTTLKKEGRLTRHVDEKKRVYYPETKP